MHFMRTKDENKKQALFKATVKLVNEIGFASSSVSKIAKEANVSPSTIYVFFDNKEDLLVSTYIGIKREMARFVLKDFDDTLPIRDIVRNLWFSFFEFISENIGNYDYCEQFAMSPYSALVDPAVIEKEFAPFFNVFTAGIEQKIIKDVNLHMLGAFMFSPLTRLANPRLCPGLEMDEDHMELAFTMMWDAVKL